MKKITARSILFTAYSIILAVFFTAYLGEKIYFLNFYIIPILIGAYYFDLLGGIGIAVLSTGLSIVFMHKAGYPLTDTPMITQIIIFGVIGTIAGLFQRENNKLNKYFLVASLTDKLTNLYNYGYFTKRIREEIERAKRYKHSLGLIMLDLDHFKNYNDTYGHENGNEVLIKTAEVITSNVRKSDVVFRYGGEEFIIILPETKEETLEIAERLRQKVETTEFPGNASVTISAGVTFYEYPKDVPADLVEQADKALYEAKEKGRNRICAFKL